MAEQNPSIVARQWEAPTTITGSFGVMDRLSSLIKAASQDDVQPQAVIALENLGVLCLVSPDLIGEGVDALKGNESIRVRDTKLLIGLSNGGTASLLRNSTSCVQGFLIIAALEICGYDEKEVGQFLFRMMTHADVLRKYAVSVKQLQTLVGAVSGYCKVFESGSGAETLNEILNSVANIKLKAVHWDRLSHDAMARLFVKVFEALQDEDLHYVEISGSTGLIWITLSLLWLIKDEFALFHEGKCIIGQADSKIRILFGLSDQSTEPGWGNTGSEQGGWVCKTWKSGQSVPQLVSIPDESARAIRFDSLTMIPARTTYNYYLASFGSHEVVEALGAAAVNIVRAALQTDVPFKHDYFRQPLSSLVNKDLPNADAFETSMLDYLGWTRGSSTLCCLNAIRDGFWQCILGKCDQHRSERSKLADRVESHVLKFFVGRVDVHPPTFSQACLSLAAQVFLSLFIRPVLPPSDPAGEAKSEPIQGPVPFFNVRRKYHTFWTDTIPVPIYCHNKLQTCRIDSLREEIFRIVLGSKSIPQNEEMKHPVAFTAGGRTGILSPLCETWDNKAGILDVCVIPGNIRFNNVNFDVVIEEVTSESDTKTSYLSQSFEKDCHQWKVIHDFAEDESVLFMRTSITSPFLKTTHLRVSYTQCINEIAGSLAFSRFKTHYPFTVPSIDCKTRVGVETWTRFGLLVVETAMKQIFEILARRAHFGYEKPQFVDIVFTRDPPWQLCSANSGVNPEVFFFFTTHAHFLPDTTTLVLLEDFTNTESLSTLLQRAVRKQIRPGYDVRFSNPSLNTEIDMGKIELLATQIVSKLPDLRLVTPPRA